MKKIGIVIFGLLFLSSLNLYPFHPTEIVNGYSSSSRNEMFKFVNVIVEVRDAYGRSVSGAWIKAFSEDWGITYPDFEGWGITNSLGIYNFRLPKGNWTFIASTGQGYSNEGIFIAITKSIDSDAYLVLKPEEKLNIIFIDENSAYIQPDEIFVFLTRLIPALPPSLVSQHPQAIFSLYVGGNLSGGLTILGIKRSTTSINYLLVGNTSLDTPTVVISAENSSEITFEAYNPDKSSSTYWDVEFRLPELYLGNWVYCFQIYGRTAIKISPTKIVLNPRFIPPNWYYYFEHIYLEPKENSKYLYRLGGQFSFHFWVIKEDTQLWFDIRDEFGNVLAFYSNPNSSRYIKLRIYEDNAVVYDKNIGPEIPGTLFYGVGRSFQDNATYNLEIDTGPILGLIKETGFLYSEERVVHYMNFTVNDFIFDVPEEYFWIIANQSRINGFVNTVLKLYNSIGNFVGEDLEAKPFTVKVNFEWCGVAGYRIIGFGVGVARWPSLVSSYASVISHELGHMFSFTSSKPYGVECPWFCEPLATYLGIEGIANIYGDNVRLWYWGSHPFFFDYIEGKANITSYLDQIETMQFVFFYIHRMYGPTVHKEFFKEWVQASSILSKYGYSNLESVVILYSTLVNEDLTWLFNLAGFSISSERVLEGMKIIAPFILDKTPPTTIAEYDGLWHNSDFTIKLLAVDNESGVAETYYRVNAGPVKRVSVDGYPLIEVEGTNNTLEYWSVDYAGNEEEHHILTGIKLDKTAPSTSINFSGMAGENGWFISDVTVTFRSNDSLSGVDSTLFSFDGVEWRKYTGAFTISLEGEIRLYFKSVDVAGNSEATKMETIKIDKTPPVLKAGRSRGATAGVLVTFDASTSTDNIGIVSYEWDFGDGAKAYGKIVTHIYTNPGIYTVTLIVKDSAGNTATQAISVTVTYQHHYLHKPLYQPL